MPLPGEPDLPAGPPLARGVRAAAGASLALAGILNGVPQYVTWLRSGFPRAPAILMIAFLVWDFLLQPIGPLEPHILLVVAWVWMGIHIMRVPDAVWRGAAPRPAAL